MHFSSLQLLANTTSTNLIFLIYNNHQYSLKGIGVYELSGGMIC